MYYRRRVEKNDCRTAGLTLVEVMVCLGIMGTLLGLLLLGVSAARESARKMQCQNNMRQSISALIQASDRQGKIPGLRSTFVTEESPGEQVLACNALIAVAREMNLSFTARGNGIRFDGSTSGEAFPPPVLTCPSIGDRKLAIRLNLGVEPVLRIKETQQEYLFGRKQLCSLADVTDGLSNTAALAERPQSMATRSLHRAIALNDGSSSFDEMIVNCPVDYLGGRIYGNEPGADTHWWGGSQYESLYDHTRPPNFSQVDCVSVSGAFSPEEFAIRFMIGTRSFHQGGSNSAFLDGSVHFVNDHIDSQTWQALGTHAGREALEEW